MADFTKIFEWTLRQEDSTLSGVVVNLGDNGGRTRFGIAETKQSNLPADFYTVDRNVALQDAALIYRQQYWNRFLGDQIADDGVASCLLSFSINDGTAREVKMLQQVLAITADGVMGPATLQRTNAFPSQAGLAMRLRQAQANWYEAIVQNNPSDARFLAGWLARARRIYPSLA